MTKSFAMVQTGAGRLEPRSLDVPEVGPDDALLRVERCGVCGADVERLDAGLRDALPVIPGHEPLGVIEEIGPVAAERWEVQRGDRVVVESGIPCRACRHCAAGDFRLCRRASAYGSVPVTNAPGLWGGFSGLMYLDPRSVVHPISKAVPLDIAATFNALAGGAAWTRLAGIELGASVVVLGPGQRGLACVVAARAAGAGTVIVTGLAGDHHKLAAAAALGADHVIDVGAADASRPSPTSPAATGSMP
jgi:threonine dehydrogenase-like Zn-dependent dehydrogenase